MTASHIPRELSYPTQYEHRADAGTYVFFNLPGCVFAFLYICSACPAHEGLCRKNTALTAKPTPIKRHFCHIGYNGLQYHGWQRQRSAVGVQAVVENALARVLKETITAVGCGRTDAMVHASQYFFHADIPEHVDFDLQERLNRNLPEDIAVFDIIPVPDNAHARFDARLRTYDYFIHRDKDPFLAGKSAWYPFADLDLDGMRAAVALLPAHQDFRAFCRTPDKVEHTICRISAARLWVNPDGARLRFQISANRFLRGMVRIITGQLLEIGMGRSSVAAFASHLQTGQTLARMHAAYPQGLYLTKVDYPDLSLPGRPEFMRILQHDEGDYWRVV
ncbi:MAG: tRNA pseudouridine synthase A [Saprospiraceae bacterium]|nr:tRNA pseudouridine synthase A [Saprospiraceae bacterium]